MTTDRNGTPLKDRPLLSIAEAMTFLRWGRDKLSSHLDFKGGPFRTVQDGKRHKVVTRSIVDFVDRDTRDLRGAVGLPTNTNQ